MVSKSHAKRRQDIKTKLMAAIAMLLVSSIMMVSSTYAWFTLSTAPEVTGISTSVGANGNLEMALLPESGELTDIKSDVGNSSAAQSVILANTTWGNLVDLEDSSYGLANIVLNPSALNETSGNLADIPLNIPKYGADGRVSELSPDTVTSVFKGTNFTQNDLYGVRAVGSASGMTDRQLAYRSYRSGASSAMVAAKNKAAASLETNGAALANIAIIRAGSATATYTQQNIDDLLAIVNALRGTTDGVDGVLEHIEYAYVQYIIAYFASAEGMELGVTDVAFNAFDTAVQDVTTIAALQTKFTELGITVSELPEGIQTYVNKLNATKTKVDNAHTELTTGLGDADSEGKYSWTQISEAMSPLVDTTKITVNGLTVDQIKTEQGINQLIQTVGSGITVLMPSEGGVYADVADHCGDYSADVTLQNLEYGSLKVEKMDARMTTKSNQTTPYLSVVGTVVQGAGAPEADTTTEKKPMTEFYGYIIDLAFRTNAAESDLLIQRTGVDRIYSDQTGNTETQGAGSTMTFASQSADFSNDQVKELMDCIRIVFFNKDDGAIYAKAKLDVDNATTTADGITANIVLYSEAGQEVTVYKSAANATYNGSEEYFTKNADVVTYEAATGVTEEQFTAGKADGTLFKDAQGTAIGADDVYSDTATYYTKKTTPGGYTTATIADETAFDAQKADLYYADTETVTTETLKEADTNENNKIVSLQQNTATSVSVLVYLDGNSITNADVAAAAAMSMKGTMNLQFASSANLVPMEYAALHPNAAPAAGDDDDDENTQG